tara:strand:+ start:162 stop:1286 length:1125 start_codon:yes stop_codon:yes gene_type:complete
MADIEATINSIMGGARNAPQPPRSLVPYLMTASEIINANIPEKRFLVSSFLPSSSFGMVYAPRGIGKSWFAFGLAKAIATGTDTFLGWKIHEAGDVLFVDGEMSLVDLKERTQAIFGSQGSSMFHLMPSEKLYQNGTPICLDMPQEHEAILQLLGYMEEANKRPKLIVLDNLSTLRRGVNENDNSETEKLLSFLVKLRHMGYAVLVVHHTNKAGEQRGASIIEVPMDYIIKLAPPDKTDAAFQKGACFNVVFTKVRNRLPQNRDFLCELTEQENGNLDFLINNSLTEVPHEVTLLRVIADGHARPSTRVFSEKLGFSVGKISKLTKKLRSEGALKKGEYVSTNRGYCILHDYFPNNFPRPETDEYEEYQNEIPF